MAYTKKDLDQLALDCVVDLWEIGIPVRKIMLPIRVTGNRRALGSCSNRGERFQISISAKLFDSEELTRLTMYHELLHTCEGCDNHGSLWKKHAAKVKTELGYNVERTCDIGKQTLEEFVSAYQKENGRSDADRKTESSNIVQISPDTALAYHEPPKECPDNINELIGSRFRWLANKRKEFVFVALNDNPMNCCELVEIGTNQHCRCSKGALVASIYGKDHPRAQEYIIVDQLNRRNRSLRGRRKR